MPLGVVCLSGRRESKALKFGQMQRPVVGDGLIRAVWMHWDGFLSSSMPEVITFIVVVGLGMRKHYILD